MKHQIKNLLITLSSLALVACNGGGGSSNTGGNTPLPTNQQVASQINQQIEFYWRRANS